MENTRNCSLYDEKKKDCGSIKNGICSGCRFCRIIGETDVEYQIRKYKEKKIREEKEKEKEFG